MTFSEKNKGKNTEYVAYHWNINSNGALEIGSIRIWRKKRGSSE